MNNSETYLEKLDDYLNQNLSEEEMKDFDEAILDNPELQEIVTQHQILIEDLKRRQIREDARTSFRKYKTEQENNLAQEDEETKPLPTINPPPTRPIIIALRPYAIAASVVGAMCCAWFLMKQDNGGNPNPQVIVDQIDTSSTATQNTKSNTNIALNLKAKPDKRTLAFADFYKEQVGKISISTLGANKQDSLKVEVQKHIKNNKIAIATSSAKAYYDAFPNDDDAILYYALCHYKQGETEKAMQLLVKIKDRNPEVAGLLKQIKD